MNETDNPFGLPAEEWAMMQTGAQRAQEPRSRVFGDGDGARCQAACCNWVDPYWWRYVPTPEQERRHRDEIARGRVMVRAWELLHDGTSWPESNYPPVMKAYFRDFGKFARNFNQGGKVDA